MKFVGFNFSYEIFCKYLSLTHLKKQKGQSLKTKTFISGVGGK